MKSKILFLIFFLFLLNSMTSRNPSRPLIFILFVVGYLWVLSLIQSGMDEIGSASRRKGRETGPLPPIPPGAAPSPKPRTAPSAIPIYLFTPLRWFFREIIGGTAGLPIMRALVYKEVRTLLASRKSFWLLFTLSLITSGYFLIFWQNNSLSVTVATRAQFSRRIFSALYLVQYCGLGLISAVMASATVTTERENKTLDLLLATRLSREQVVLAKWFSNIIYQLVLLAALMPVQALAFQLGGVGLDDYLGAALLVMAAVACHGMIGLAVSCHLQRTVPALLAAVGISTLVGFFVPGHLIFEQRAPASGMAAAIAFMVPLGIAFVVAWRVAWHGLAYRDTYRAAVAPPVIDDKQVLKARRETWPYYLIDPLARPQDIADGQNPVYVKEQRISPLGRLDVIIRLCYVAMFISFVLTVAKGISGTFTALRFIATWEASFLLVFVPVLAATGISREYEENTIGILCATPLTPAQIILAKYRVTMRLFAILTLSLLIVPIAFYTGMSLADNSMHSFKSLSEPLGGLMKITPLLLAWTAFYAAASLLCSSICRRNVTAIVASYATMLAGLASPRIIGFLLSLLDAGGVLGDGAFSKAVLALLAMVRRYVCPLLSPYDYFDSAAGNPDGHYFDEPESWLQIYTALILIGSAVVVLLALARRLMVRGARK